MDGINYELILVIILISLSLILNIILLSFLFDLYYMYNECITWEGRKGSLELKNLIMIDLQKHQIKELEEQVLNSKYDLLGTIVQYTWFTAVCGVIIAFYITWPAIPFQ